MHSEETYSGINLTNIVLSDDEPLPDDVRRSLVEIAIKDAYENGAYEIIHKKITTNGGNYLGLLFDVKIKYNNNDEEKAINLFIKQAICGDHIKSLDILEVFSKEIFFYRELCKIFGKLQNEAAMPADDRYNFVQSYSGSTPNAVILENMTKQGYGTIYRMDVMPLKLAQLSIQQLARFHALSFIIEQKMPEYFNSKIKTLKPSLIFGEHFDQYCDEIYRTALIGIEQETKKKLEEKFTEYLEKFKLYILRDDYKIKTLCHGDYRMYNMLMKVTEGVINDVIPVDFQLLFYSSPKTDFMYFIFSGTDQMFRENHLEDLKNLYYSTMGKYLKYFDFDISDIYPRKQFDIDYDNCLEYGLLLMLFMTPIVFTVDTDIPDLNKNQLNDLTLHLDSSYYYRLKGIIDDMTAYGKFLKNSSAILK